MSTFEELQRQLDEYRLIFNSLPIMIWYKDKENRHIRVTKAAAELEGLSVEAMEGTSAFDLYPREQAEIFHKDDLEVIESGKPKLEIIEKHQKAASTQVMWLRTGKVPSRDVDGNITGVIAFAVDITKQHMAEQALKQVRDLLQSQNIHLHRTNAMFRQTLDQLAEAIQQKVTAEELLKIIDRARREFDK